jgi:hypothetical protein
MTGNHSAAKPDHNRALEALLDLLLPGGDGWPGASAAGATIADDWAAALALALAGMAPELRAAHLATVEQREPEQFQVMLRAAYRAYYTTPSVQARIVALANAGPREASQHFDETLVARVIATRSGQRRL